MKNKYLEWKKQCETFISNQKGLFFAFSEKQYKEGIERVGATEDNKICSIGGGGYILTKDLKTFNEFFENRIKSLHEKLINDQEFAKNAFDYELSNHEYCYSGDESETLDVLEIDNEFIEKNGLSKLWEKAKKEAYSSEW